MASALGFDDLFYTGWLLATLNLSDLAAAGAQPLGLLTSLVLPAATTVTAFTRLLDGIDECCATVGVSVIGGNLKEAPTLDVSATAIGTASPDELVTRVGAEPGDRVLVVGDLGAFWAGALAYREGLIDVGDAAHPLMRNVLTPTAKVNVMRELAAAGLVKAAMDNSDGLYPSLAQLAASNHTGILVEADRIHYVSEVASMARTLEIDPLRLAMGWGDWQIVAACEPANVELVASLAAEHGVGLHDIGAFTVGVGVTLERLGSVGPLMRLDSERFVPSSWFSSGLDGYVRALREAPLFAESSS
jgi:thiamine-monophosphate kinase